MTKKVVVIINKYDPKMSGSTYMKRVADYLDIQIYDLCDYSFIMNYYMKMKLSKVGRFVERLPFFEDYFRKVIVKLCMYTTSENFKNLLKDSEIIVPSCATSHTLYFALLATPKPIHYVCMDLPWGFKNSKINKESIKRQTKKLVSRCKSVNICTPDMLDELLGDKCVPAFITYSSIDLTKPQEMNPKPLIMENIKIVYAGALRFRSEIIKVLNHLDTLNIKYSFDIYSKDDIKDSRVKFRGYLAQAELELKLREYDYGFVPMSYSSDDALVVSTSFPGKAMLYIQNGLPILFAAPAHSSIAKFSIEHKVGIHYRSLERREMRLQHTHTFQKSLCDEWARFKAFVLNVS